MSPIQLKWSKSERQTHARLRNLSGTGQKPVHGRGAKMMHGGGCYGGAMGAYGGVWIPILLVVIVGLLAWIVMQKRK